jgi:hypothetical protein
MIVWVRVFATITPAYFRTDVKTGFSSKTYLLLYVRWYVSITHGTFCTNNDDHFLESDVIYLRLYDEKQV